MKIKGYKMALYAIAVLLGCVFADFSINGFQQKSTQKVVADYVFKGCCKEKINFKEYRKGLFLSDSTVLKYKEGILGTPSIAGQVAFALVEDRYSYDEAKFRYPYVIYSDIYSWNISCTSRYSLKDDEILLGTLGLSLQRSNGMLINMHALK